MESKINRENSVHFIPRLKVTSETVAVILKENRYEEKIYSNINDAFILKLQNNKTN